MSGSGGTSFRDTSFRKRAPRTKPLRFEVLRVNVLQVFDIDHVAQKFSAKIFLQFRIPDGVQDPDLLRDLDDVKPQFPKDTLRPGARWFMEQFDFPNARDFQILESKVVVMDRHIDIVLKTSGTFFEVMELECFPVDVQELTLIISMSVAQEGICAAEFTNLLDDGGTTVATVNTTIFSMSNMWQLSPVARLAHRTLQPMQHTTYPAIAVTAFIARRQGYYIFNVLMPLGSLQFLATLQYLLPGDFSRVADRIAYSVTLLLTSAAYKLFVSSTLPDISYLTLIDRYVLFNFSCQVGMILPSLAVGFFRRGELRISDDATSLSLGISRGLTDGETIDLVLMGVSLLCFAALHAWITQRYVALRARKAQAMEEHQLVCTSIKGGGGRGVHRDSMGQLVTMLTASSSAYRDKMTREATRESRSAREGGDVEEVVEASPSEGVGLGEKQGADEKLHA